MRCGFEVEYEVLALWNKGWRLYLEELVLLWSACGW